MNYKIRDNKIRNKEKKKAILKTYNKTQSGKQGYTVDLLAPDLSAVRLQRTTWQNT